MVKIIDCVPNMLRVNVEETSRRPQNKSITRRLLSVEAIDLYVFIHIAACPSHLVTEERRTKYSRNLITTSMV